MVNIMEQIHPHVQFQVTLIRVICLSNKTYYLKGQGKNGKTVKVNFHNLKKYFKIRFHFIDSLDVKCLRISHA